MTTAEESGTTRQAGPPEAGPPEETPAGPATGSPGGVRVGEVLDRELRRGAAMVGRVRDRLPTNPVPVYLGVAALAVTGLVSWPVAVAAGCGYAAFRHWEPRPSGVPAPMPSAGRR
ncbi:hypothetical protein [Actinomycetospora lemnae]|uniref:DUF3040 domain-containing protein n=1 Tax=Actinomycetospora lemnae TaxID=3019891 RepID=A0ABT5SYQ1_9PSEU|nr:hypothetical protein [Actinomycetospora sp. DW7H6]MDD7967988.1 hypothetical protein [Actinomycetospora sp. DW7H6]